MRIFDTAFAVLVAPASGKTVVWRCHVVNLLETKDEATTDRLQLAISEWSEAKVVAGID